MDDNPEGSGRCAVSIIVSGASLQLLYGRQGGVQAPLVILHIDAVFEYLPHRWGHWNARTQASALFRTLGRRGFIRSGDCAS